MGWSVGFDTRWNRDIGYGVPAVCDHPEHDAAIDRGLSYVCGGEPYGGEHGCGLFFCGEHLMHGYGEHVRQQCERCAAGKPPFTPKPDTAEWLEWKLTDESWGGWRLQRPEAAERACAALAAAERGAERLVPAPGASSHPLPDQPEREQGEGEQQAHSKDQ